MSELNSEPVGRTDPAVRVFERRQRVQSAETAVSVLKGLASIGGRAGLTTLSAHLDLSTAKVHRYLVSLIREGLVDQDLASQQYFLGAELMQIGLAAMRQAEPIRLIEPALARLRESLEITCFAAVMGNKGPTIMRFEEPGLPVTINVRAGSVMSLVWSASGRVFLGLLNDSKVHQMAKEELKDASTEMLSLLPAVDPIEFLRAEVRAVGCSVVRDTYLRGISAISAPVFDFTGKVCAAITALGASGGFDPSVNGEVGTAVRNEARLVSEKLGFTYSK